MGFENFIAKPHEKTIDYEKEEKIKEEIQEKILEIKKGGESIGKGTTAEVFVSKIDSSVCYKIIYKEHPVFRNSTGVESEIQSKLVELAKDVKVPKPYYYDDKDPDLEVLVMERMDAVSLEDVVFRNQDIPDKFDYSEFFQKIEKFVQKMNDNRIHHRDLHGGNIMIDKNTGEPCIIDFGSAKEQFISSENPYQNINAKGEMEIFTSDVNRIKEERMKLRKSPAFKRHYDKIVKS